MIKFNQNAWLKPYIDMNTDLKNFEIYFFKAMNNAVFGKTVWKNIGILNLSQEKEEETISCQNQIMILQSFSQKIYQVWFLVWLWKIKIWWKRKTMLHGERQFHFIYKTNDIYKDIAEDVETRFNTSN